MDVIQLSLMILLLMLIVSSFIMFIAIKDKSENFRVIQLYILPLTYLIILFSLNYSVFNIYTEAYSYAMICIAFLVNGRQIYSDYINNIRRPMCRIKYHVCTSAVITIIVVFSILYSAIESYIPNSFSNVSTSNPIAMSIDFLYFSLTTFTTVGFGDIAPQTTLTRSVVSLEILTAFAMLVLAINFLVVKKDFNENVKGEENKDELSEK